MTPDNLRALINRVSAAEPTITEKIGRTHVLFCLVKVTQEERDYISLALQKQMDKEAGV